MYRKKSRGWYKHKDFILIDLACLFMALILAYLIRNGSVRNLFTLGIYRNVMIFVILVDLFLIILFESYKGVLRRGRYQELRSVIRQMILIELASGLYLFTVSGGHTFSRIILYLMGIFYVLLSYCTRIIWKKHLLHKMAEGGEHSLYIVTNYDLASKVIQNVKEHNYNRYNINGLILIDKDMTGKEIAGVQVVADLNNAPSFICQQWVDEVFVNVDETYPYPQELIEELLEMGMPVHVNLAKVRSTPGQKQFVEAIGGYTVLTTTMNYATDRQALAKRVLDILGGLVGCFLTGIIFIFIAPAIYISSPGPIFFSQTRIGKNGKPFKMYKFRSMYMDAEERKAELMAQNKMSDGRMFKLDFDPRVIGNKILPDGTRKTGILEQVETFYPEYNCAIAACDDGTERLEWNKKLETLYNIPVLFHMDSTISPSANLMPGCIVEPRAVVGCGSTIGQATVIGANTVVEPYSFIGDSCTLKSGTIVKSTSMVAMNTSTEQGSVLFTSLTKE